MNKHNTKYVGIDLGDKTSLVHVRNEAGEFVEETRKSDRVDAEYLAKLVRLDPSLQSPVIHRREEAHKHLAILRSQDILVQARTGYVLTLEDVKRFKESREVGPDLGMLPRRNQSGDAEPEGRITKTGDKYLRRLLVGSAHYILGPFGEGSRLRS